MGEPLREPFREPAVALDEDVRAYLLEVADDAIRSALEGRRSEARDLSDAPPGARVAAGAFVTVTVDGELNGCIGTMEPEALADAVPRLAYQAAFEDPRLPALRRRDYDGMALKVSVLSPMSPIAAATEEELLGQLRPGVDGLLIRSGWHRATFLPAVWDTLPDPRDFLHHLLLKAGLRPGHWPRDLEALRYTSEEFGATSRAITAARRSG